MKPTLIIFLMASAVLARAQTGEMRTTPSCGPGQFNFEVQTNKGSHQLGQAEAGKALVYFLQDDSELVGESGHTNRLGVDGRWVGATHGDSYFYFSLDPGEHHLCASWQKGALPGLANHVAEAHFKAEAGGVYFFKAKNFRFTDRRATSGISLGPVDGDEGKLMVSKYSFSTFQHKK
ncbi:MAG: DUF2846 domain-containing protein [Terriglobia bacterium]